MDNTISLIEKWKNRSSDEVEVLKNGIDQISREMKLQELDQLAQDQHREVTKKINCLDCGNCCRTSVTDFSRTDVKSVAKHLEMTPKAFIKKYLIEDLDGTYVTITSPCPFLDLNTNACNIYEVRPTVCSSYPHTHRDGFSKRRKAHKANLDMCPITYHVVKKMLEQ
jgi:Fe-S-cluster containining protein